MMLSREGYEKLKNELEQLKSVERQRVADNIREAKSHGDLRENAMYHEARLNQRRLESRISELERVILTAQIVEKEDRVEGTAHLGTKVKVKDLEFGDEMVLTLVGAFEADPVNDMISITSPLGESLVGKSVGAEVQVVAPGGTQNYVVLSIESVE